MRNAFEDWWFKTTHPWTEFPKDPMEIAEISWDAAVKHISPEKTMKNINEEQTKAYEVWWSDPALPNNTKDIFFAGWEAALANRPIVVETIHLVARQNERPALKRKFLALASTAFLAGQDEEAKMYRSIADLHL